MRKRLTHRKRRDCEPEEHQGSRRADPRDHPVTCGCRVCLLELGAELDPDSMEDEDSPFFWNRRTW